MNLSNRIFDRIADSAIVRSFQRAVDTRNWSDIALALFLLALLAPIIIGVFLVLALAIVALNGWALHIMWSWFVVPLGVTAVTVPQAMGIYVVTGMLARSGRPTPKSQASTRCAHRTELPLPASTRWRSRPADPSRGSSSRRCSRSHSPQRSTRSCRSGGGR